MELLVTVTAEFRTGRPQQTSGWSSGVPRHRGPGPRRFLRPGPRAVAARSFRGTVGPVRARWRHRADLRPGASPLPALTGDLAGALDFSRAYEWSLGTDRRTVGRWRARPV